MGGIINEWLLFRQVKQQYPVGSTVKVKSAFLSEYGGLSGIVKGHYLLADVWAVEVEILFVPAGGMGRVMWTMLE